MKRRNDTVIYYDVDGIPLSIMGTRHRWIPYINDVPVPSIEPHYETTWEAYREALLYIAEDTLVTLGDALSIEDKDRFARWYAMEAIDTMAHQKKHQIHRCNDRCAIPSHHSETAIREFYAARLRLHAQGSDK